MVYVFPLLKFVFWEPHHPLVIKHMRENPSPCPPLSRGENFRLGVDVRIIYGCWHPISSGEVN